MVCFKVKKLKALGKHHHYYRHLGDFEGKKVKRYKRKSNTRLRKRKSDEEEEDEEDEGDQASLNHPPGQHISFTTPPQPSEREGNYRDVMDLMHDNENLPQLSKFPVDFPRLYIGGNGQGSRIPILVNKRHSAWGWTSQWYRRQLIDENKTAQAVERLKSSRNLLSARVSEKHLMKPSQERIPSKVIQKHEYPASVQTLYKAPSDLNGPPPSSPEAEIHASVVKVAPSLPPISPPPPVTPVRAEPKIDPSVLEKRSYLQQRQDIAARYTFHLEGLTSALHTEIPKLPPKKSYKQLMILRAGPRKKASQIEEIRQKRKSSLSSETPPPPKDNTPRRKAEDRGKRPT
ncbi:ATP synthase subunit beta [Orchesella cincta]|uniref:ATP synthase subunit beta n=1 Tax=Orchesella cincta TaxID=48709 RepID=A0A1D2NC03_ORCCI|nr:ATP synthase subunit beta [Orchesella cincta]